MTAPHTPLAKAARIWSNPPASEVTPREADAETARQAGRGALALSAAKVVFIILGFAQQFLLYRVMGIASYGALRSALSPSSITYNTIVTTGIQGMSHVTSVTPKEQGGPGGSPVRAAFLLHAAMSTTIALVFFLTAPWLAAALGAPHITEPLQLLAFVVFLYGLYAPLIGILNGRRKFLHQAGLDMSAAVLRTLGLLLGAWYCVHWGSGFSPVSGAVMGFVASAIVVLIAALILVGKLSGASGQSNWGDHLGFIGPVLVGQAVLNLLLQADLNTLRYFSSRAAEAAGRPVTDADALVGAYSASQLFGFLPYQLMIGLGFILFPMLTKAHQETDKNAIGRYVQTGVRVAMLATGLIVSVSAGLSHELLSLAFSKDAADLGATPMRVLMFGLAAFAVFGALVTVLNSLHKQWQSLAVTASAFALVLVLNGLLVRGEPFGSALLLRTALSTSIALLLATLIAAFLVQRSAGAVVPFKTVLRVCAAIGLSALVGEQLPDGGHLFTVLYSALIASLYVVLLLVTRELRADDLANLKAIVTRKKRPSS